MELALKIDKILICAFDGNKDVEVAGFSAVIALPDTSDGIQNLFRIHEK